MDRTEVSGTYNAGSIPAGAAFYFTTDYRKLLTVVHVVYIPYHAPPATQPTAYAALQRTSQPS